MGTKHHSSPERDYRQSVSPGVGETGFQVAVEQTDLWIVAEQDLRHEMAEAVRDIRGIIKNHILLHPDFAASLSPLPIPDAVPAPVLQMYRAAEICGVGPMAAVAGTVAQFVGERFMDVSPNLLVENGGDTWLASTRERVVALLPDPESGVMIGLRVEVGGFPVSICSSSATIGHSLSLGSGELVTVRARDGALADAAATSLCNGLRSRRDIDDVLAVAQGWATHGVEGVFLQGSGQIAAWGAMELVAVDG